MELEKTIFFLLKNSNAEIYLVLGFKFAGQKVFNFIIKSLAGDQSAEASMD